ncbi:MAG: flagellar basal body rod protein FlgF [Oceanococcus sp.]|nr:MAG: flagellar basal body rod protein FlgF [Oceanococcus sp.]
MDKSLYVAMTGARQAWDAQTAVSHNIANASTVGFKAALLNVESREVSGDGFHTRVHAQARAAGFDASSGHLMHTDRALDVALADDHWLAVLGSDGETAYTRAGDLSVNALGQLLTSSGQPVMGEGGAVALPPFSAIEVAGDGTLSIIPEGAGANQMVVLDRLMVSRIEGADLDRGSDGLFRLKGDAEAAPAPGKVLVSGALEASNVNLAESLVQMIEHQRRFEMQVQAMKTADENARQSAGLMKLA